ncbi:MAG: polyphosphate kinase 1 [Bacteroidetes bacterium]|nr:MAG: polyphosphate kinase 1 [Bacteroidota bacterium]
MTLLHKHINRELSWLQFNERVLQEAMDTSVPIIERLRFLGIFSNNRDEFFRVRVASIRRMMQVIPGKEEKLGFSPRKLLKDIQRTVEQQEELFTNTFRKIITDLEKEHIFFRSETELTPAQESFVQHYFQEKVRPLLFPIILNNLSNPDALRDNSIYLALWLRDSSGRVNEDFALVRVPSDIISRFLLLPGDNKSNHQYIIMLDDVIRFAMGDIFKPFGYDTFDAYTIKFTRDAELDIDNDIKKSFIELMEESLKKRKKGVPVRFVYDNEIPPHLLKKLLKKLRITEGDHLRGGGRYHNFKDFMDMPNPGSSDLVYPKLAPIPHPDFSRDASIFKAIKRNDILLHYPYHSFQYIVDLLREASIDPKVKSIKMTFYRAAHHSNVINSLINAARNGKSVTVYLEIKARFDEANNIYWAEKLREEGVNVIKTLPGFKVHAKLILIRREEEDKNQYYTNISTGNFNESTAKFYTDSSLLTNNREIGKEVKEFFHLIESPFNPPKFKHLSIAPTSMRNHLIKMLATEIKNAKEGKEAWAIIKLNNLVDEKIVRKLLQASQAGVKIKMIVRGICVLMPGIKDFSENISVISIIDIFLEHPRIFVFANGGNPHYFLSSADWMIRNFDHRFEVATPVYDKKLQQELWDILQIQLKDNVKARLVNSNPPNQYKQTSSKIPIRSQQVIYEYLKQKSIDS